MAVHFPSEQLIIDYLKAHPCTTKTDEKVIAAAADRFANKYVIEDTIIQECTDKSFALALIDCGRWRNPRDDGR